MSEAKKETTIFEIADQFIALANEISATEQDVGKVGTGLRFAAARFNAFEASLKSADLAAEKDNAVEWFGNEYKEMLKDNIEDHIKNPSQPKAEEPAKDDSVQQFNS
ncbi:DUF3144 domain-containing protein [Shewanella sp. Choline-02u-19]|uniref:DUF3144 domain-containing protein n=1 Tax=Shewanella TaxID=22 RepID=UPI000C3436ED|nr:MULTISPECIES: DUF3144 domain-containing protein [Shewanella]MCL1058512.1 DUF3144 domain-containing protein [Shewanella gelidimarina]PKG57869.1 DUF3144 domain-containing protein [Shewanella sp. GutDb-MelDb]PKG76042.1 DUF3144 domain-containing protein [Shewanella sp. GutCb]PKH56677.1 DUF3144 domain-containing protein [Shewanella sp. Bg11-22]PKI30228.1 DUF3144 domain-containing protein [Shewanella sp. Choline-02u-19]